MHMHSKRGIHLLKSQFVGWCEQKGAHTLKTEYVFILFKTLKQP